MVVTGFTLKHAATRLAEIIREAEDEASVRIDGKWLREIGFTHLRGKVECYRTGPRHAMLYVVSGHDDSWWAMLVKFPQDLEYDAAKFPHIERRLRTRGDVRILCEALGIKVEEKCK